MLHLISSKSKDSKTLCIGLASHADTVGFMCVCVCVYVSSVRIQFWEIVLVVLALVPA